MEYSASAYLSLPGKPGIYQFIDSRNTVLYVGKAKDLKKRVSSYFIKGHTLGDKTTKMISQIEKIRVIEVESELESLLLEANFIKKFRPKYNIRLTDDKSYFLIRVSSKHMYPSVLLARHMDDKKSVYFGPYPSSKTVKMVLRTIRRIFPFQSVLNHPKKVCLYNHLGLCPCIPVLGSEENKAEYKKNIRHIINFLNGEKPKVLKELEKDRDEHAKKEQFEEAQKSQKKIDAILYVTSPIHKPFEYETNPNLRVDLRQKELNDLRQTLKSSGTETEYLKRIECFDISNIQGTNSVGSMVVFTDGEKDASQYRRFKITDEIVGPNDFASMEQVLRRRLKHHDWEKPNLIIVDGGKGQISAAMKALEGARREARKRVPLVGLAKRDETIITSDFKEIVLSRNSDALKLMMRIRDEAHRFAITYHRKLRSKAALQTFKENA